MTAIILGDLFVVSVICAVLMRNVFMLFVAPAFQMGISALLLIGMGQASEAIAYFSRSSEGPQGVLVLVTLGLANALMLFMALTDVRNHRRHAPPMKHQGPNAPNVFQKRFPG